MTRKSNIPLIATATAQVATALNFSANIDEVMEKFNKRFIHVLDGGKALIFRDFEKESFVPIEQRPFEAVYNEPVATALVRGALKYETEAKIWLNSTHRNKCLEGVIFDPSTTDAPEGMLNLYRGFAHKPAQGEWSLMKAHIFEIICDGDKVNFDYLMGWMARLFQHPAEIGYTAVVLKGGEGTGKGTLANALIKIIGRHAMATSFGKHVVGNFNSHLRDKIFLFADEAFFAGDKANVGTLKSIITEPMLTIEEKFHNAIQSPNYLHILMASNEEWVIPAALDARRFFVLVLKESKKTDLGHFSAIRDQMDAGGYDAMLYELLNFDLNGFKVRAVPRTKGLEQQIKLSLSPHEVWWKECLERGYVYSSKYGIEEFMSWENTMSTDLLFLSYNEFRRNRSDRYPLSREAFGQFLQSMNYRPTRLSGKRPIGERPSQYGGETIDKVRPHGYVLGELEAARNKFTEKNKLTLERDNYDEEAEEAVQIITE